MELELIRQDFTEKSTIGRLLIDGQFECFILEDKDRGLHQAMPLAEIEKIKINERTCIPYGRYQVVITHSPRFGRPLPLLLDTPGYKGIRIHPGNKSEDTEGCLLPGSGKSLDFVSGSVAAFTRLENKLKSALQKGKVYITITT